MNKNIFAHANRDLAASIVVFFVAVPLCLGIALASGAPLFAGILQLIMGFAKTGFIAYFFPSSLIRMSHTNNLPHIAAHLQGTQNSDTKPIPIAIGTKVLQLPTHCNHSAVRPIK